MAASGGASRNRTKERNSARAAMMKALGIVRQTQTCPVCYRTISCESPKSRYTHVCK